MPRICKGLQARIVSAGLLAVAACSSGRTGTERSTGNPAPPLAAGGGTGKGPTVTGGAGTSNSPNAGAPSASGGAPIGGGGSGGAGGATGTDASTVPPPPAEPKIPPLPATCPELRTGNVTVMGQSVTLWVGEKQPGAKGPLLFYWHGTGSTADEPTKMISPVIDDVVSTGGIVASFSTTLGTGTNTSTGSWYTGDFAMADVLVACAAAAEAVDTHRIYAAGCSAGGLQAAPMAFLRSSYLAGVMTNSGGIDAFPELTVLQDPGNVPALIAAHEKEAGELVDIPMLSQAACKAIKDAGGFAVDCVHDGGHCSGGVSLATAQWLFLKAHPFGTRTDPYGGKLPPGFPPGCTPL